MSILSSAHLFKLLRVIVLYKCGNNLKVKQNFPGERFGRTLSIGLVQGFVVLEVKPRQPLAMIWSTWKNFLKILAILKFKFLVMVKVMLFICMSATVQRKDDIKR